MAKKYEGISTDKNRYITTTNENDATLAYKAGQEINPIYAAQEAGLKDANTSNQANRTATQQGIIDRYNQSKSELDNMLSAEQQRQSADAAKRGLTLGTNVQNKTAEEYGKATGDMLTQKQQQYDNVQKEIALADTELQTALKNADFAKASQILTYKNQKKQEGQALFTDIKQFNWKAKQAQKSGGGGGRGGSGGGGSLFDQLLKNGVTLRKLDMRTAYGMNLPANRVQDDKGNWYTY